MWSRSFDECLLHLDSHSYKYIHSHIHAAILKAHPDKGGDAATFRKIRTAFEVLRDLKTHGSLGSFTTHLSQGTDDYYNSVFDDFNNTATPSYEHYYHAAQEQVPGYKVELAKSGRSQCVACQAKQKRRSKPPPKKKSKTNDEATTTTMIVAPIAVAPPIITSAYIDKDVIRVGSLDDTSGSYGRWHHLDCWRVPYRIWAGLTNPADADQVLQDLLYMEEVLLTNLSCLTTEQQQQVVAHVMDKSHWARKTAASKPPPKLRAAAGMVPSDAITMSSSTIVEQSLVVAPDAAQSTTIVKKTTVKEHFIIPRPGINGAIANVLDQKRFVLTGIFPEVGGGTGLNLGKDRVKAMMESFGGVVTSSVSGKTNYLVVGKEPGGSKVDKARARNLPIVDLKILQTRILGQAESLEAAGPPPKIESVSAGYQGRFIGY